MARRQGDIKLWQTTEREIVDGTNTTAGQNDRLKEVLAMSDTCSTGLLEYWINRVKS